MNKIRCMIVDDEPLAIQLIENHISKLDRLEVVKTCSSAIKAFEVLNTVEIDLLFLDIKMPSMTGLEFLRTIKKPPKTILTTAYREFAIEGYDLDVVDYLLKPITFERFFKSVDRYLRTISEKEVTSSLDESIDEFILIRSGNKHHKISLKSITYIESAKDYISVHTADGAAIESKYRISAMEEKLEGKGFLRVHRSFIIRLEHIKAFSNHDIMVGPSEVPIGASYRESVSEYLESLK